MAMRNLEVEVVVPENNEDRLKSLQISNPIKLLRQPLWVPISWFINWLVGVAHFKFRHRVKAPFRWVGIGKRIRLTEHELFQFINDTVEDSLEMWSCMLSGSIESNVQYDEIRRLKFKIHEFESSQDAQVPNMPGKDSFALNGDVFLTSYKENWKAAICGGELYVVVKVSEDEYEIVFPSGSIYAVFGSILRQLPKLHG